MSITKKRLLTYTVLIMSLIITVNLIKDILRLSRSDDRLAAARADLNQAQQEQAELKQELDQSGGEMWLEKQIRDVLKMARPNEVVVVIPDTVKQGGEIASLPQEEEVGPSSNFVKWRQVFGF